MGNDWQLIPLDEADVPEFKREMREAFQTGYEQVFGPCAGAVLPDADVERSLRSEGAAAYVVRRHGRMAGGAIVRIDRATGHNHLELLFVRVGMQGGGVGQAIWRGLEERYPETVVWETCTPYFEKRNIHFYVNCCGFHIVEFFHPRHRFPGEEREYHGGMSSEAADYFFRFEKRMPSRHGNGASPEDGPAASVAAAP